MKTMQMDVVIEFPAHMEMILAVGGQIEHVVACDNDCCQHESHDATFHRVCFPVVAEERLNGAGCVNEQCACNSHPPGYHGRALYQLPDGNWLVCDDARSIGHYPRLGWCADPEVDRVEMARFAEDYLADCMLHD